jgi:hypothetical protein
MVSGVGIDHRIWGKEGAEHPVMIEMQPGRSLQP